MSYKVAPGLDCLTYVHHSCLQRLPEADRVIRTQQRLGLGQTTPAARDAYAARLGCFGRAAPL